MTGWQTWRTATARALYGESGFFRREAPADHFRTSVHASGLFARAVHELTRTYDLDTVVDVGAGRGELLLALQARDPDLALIGVEVADRPSGLPPGVRWEAGIPDGTAGLVVANEWLDNVPVDVAEVDDAGVARLVEVEPGGRERLGQPVDGRDATWLARWWPLTDAPPGTRAEIGWPRDTAWSDAVRRIARGVLIAIDYGHTRATRPDAGTLTGYRDGVPVYPVPDGGCDLTAHVAMDAVRAAGEEAGAKTLACTSQSQALRGLGLSAARPPLALARSDPAAYLAALNEVGEASELLDPAGLGGFHWLTQGVAGRPR